MFLYQNLNYIVTKYCKSNEINKSTLDIDAILLSVAEGTNFISDII